MMKIEVKNSDVRVKSGVSAKTGKSYSMREQDAYLHTYGRDGKPNAYPERIVLTLEDNQDPYAPGTYSLCPTSIYVGSYGSVNIRPRLVVADVKQIKAA